MGSLPDMGPHPDLINKDFLYRVWNESIRLIKSPQMQTANLDAVSREVITPLFTFIGDLHESAKFGII